MPPRRKKGGGRGRSPRKVNNAGQKSAEEDDAAQAHPPPGDRRNLKPVLEVGEEVYSAWWPDEERSDQPMWYPGTIQARRDVESGDGSSVYGPTYYYDVTFDDGDEVSSVEDRHVFRKVDYELSKFKLIGVENVVDKKSTDEWARTVGWFVVNIDGQDHAFSFLSDALEAYDKDVVRKKGKATKESDLNLPEKWPELFNRSEGDPGEEDAEGEVEEDVKVGKEEVKEQKKVDAEEKEKLGCPSCGKLFATPGGLKYHTDKKVCQRKEKNDSAKKAKADNLPLPSSEPKPSRKQKATKRLPSDTESDKDDSDFIGDEDGGSDEDFTSDDKENPEGKEEVGTEEAEVQSQEDVEGKKKFPCPNCGKLYASRGALKGHTDKKSCEKSSTISNKLPGALGAEHQSILQLICPHCKKQFQSEKRLATHLDKKVCQRKEGGDSSAKKAKANTSPHPFSEPKSARKRKASTFTPAKRPPPDADSDKDDSAFTGDGDEESDEDFTFGDRAKKTGRKGKERAPSVKSTEKYAKLDAGAMFLTRFGVVEVIADDRLPAKHHTSTVDQKARRSYLKRKVRFEERSASVFDNIAAGTRRRRDALQKMYLDTRGRNMAQEDVWGLYCQSLTPKQILTDGASWKDSIDGSQRQVETFTETDPRLAEDFYPHRIVECKLIRDKRHTLVCSLGDDSKLRSREKIKRKGPVVPMRLFIARNELTRPYESTALLYVCDNCGRDYTDRPGIAYHLKNGNCSSLDDEESNHRRLRLESIESKARSGTQDTFLAKPHAPLILKAKDVKVADAPPAFGNPHKIKEFKKHKMPPWLVFNAERSSMYPEVYHNMLGFKRGSQNRNFFNKMKQEDGYLSKSEKGRFRKRLKRIRMIDPGAKPAADFGAKPSFDPSGGAQPSQSSNLNTSEIQATSEKPPQKQVALKKTPPPKQTADYSTKKSSKKQAAEGSAKKPSTKKPAKETAKKSAQKTRKTHQTAPPAGPAALPPLPTVGDGNAMDVDVDNGTHRPTFDTTPDPASLGEDEYLGDFDLSDIVDRSKSGKGRRKKGPLINKNKKNIVVDTEVLAQEIHAGRYPTMSRFHGEHDEHCCLCRKASETPLINCDFCKNSVHQLCLDKRMLLKDPQVVLRESEPDDAPMCHECINACLFRRWRAENRRVTKWQHELAKAGLGDVPDAASLREEVNLKGGKVNDGDDDDDVTGVMGADDEKPTYEACPDGGPGGLICCSYCTAAYSRFLSNTAKEMEAQSVSRIGQEVSEILELLADAKSRLGRASDVSQSNEERRGLLDPNQTAHSAEHS